MSLIYKFFIVKLLRLFPLVLLFYISLKDDSLFNFSFFNFLSLNFQYIIIYYWVLKSPQVLGYGFIFLAGIVTDVILGLPMGTSPLSYLSIATLAAYTRIVTVRTSLLMDWFTFAPALLLANLIHFLVLYFYDISIHYLNIFTGSLFTFIFFPILWGVFEVIRGFMKVSQNA